jgi:hypothetical protein
MDANLLKQIQILNQHVADLTQTSQGLLSVAKHSQELDVNTLITALVGLFGVLVGSCISYYFSKKIANESSKARFAVQRKNLIYSKIYKELIYMREQIELLPKNWFYFQLKTNLVNTKINRYGSSDYWVGGKNDYIAPVFKVWKDIRSDIRMTQINNEVLLAMDALEKAVINYFNSINQFEEELRKTQGAVGLTMNRLDDVQFFFSNFNKEECIERDLKQFRGNTPEWINTRRELLSKVITPTLVSPFLKESEVSFNLLKEKTQKAYLTLEKLIKYTVNTYEYGENI